MIPRYVPLLVRRRAREPLRGLRGLTGSDAPAASHDTTRDPGSSPGRHR